MPFGFHVDENDEVVVNDPPPAANKSDRYKPRHKHYLQDALNIVRELQAVAWPCRFHVTLGGGVLNHGYSDKDIDIYVQPFYARAGEEAIVHDVDELQAKFDTVFGSRPERDYMDTSGDGRLDADGAPYTELSEQPTCFARALNYRTQRVGSGVSDELSVDIFIVKP